MGGSKLKRAPGLGLVSRWAGGLAAVASGANKILGYSLSMVALAIASLAAIPAMVAADGPSAWAAIAVGQSVGGVAAVAIAYGWGLTGPAAIARSSRAARGREYVESLVVKSILVVPAAGAAAALSALLVPAHAALAIAGALSTATIGLTASWYFVGLSKPYLLLSLETLPRVAGTAAGILLMVMGHSALTGVLCQLAGMAVAFLVCSVWILHASRVPREQRLLRRRAGRILASQGVGVSSTLLSAGYVAAPLMIVSAIAPIVLPAYAIVDKVQRQVSVALNPSVSVFQGWVPQATGAGLSSRILKALGLSAAFSAALGVSMYVIAPYLVSWLGGSQIHPSNLTLALMAAFVALNLFESVVAKAILTTIDRVNVVATATLFGAIVGLPLVAFGAVLFGAAGAIGGIVVGLATRLAVELIVLSRFLRHASDGVVLHVIDEEQQREYL